MAFRAEVFTKVNTLYDPVWLLLTNSKSTCSGLSRFCIPQISVAVRGDNFALTWVIRLVSRDIKAEDCKQASYTAETSEMLCPGVCNIEEGQRQSLKEKLGRQQCELD